MKKIALTIAAVAVVLITIMVMLSLNKTTEDGNISNTSNENDTAIQDEVTSVADMEEVDILDGCELSEEEMTQVILDYYESLEQILSQNGDDAKVDVKTTDEGVYVYVNNESEPRLEWGSVREAFSFLYGQGQVDKEGNILA